MRGSAVVEPRGWLAGRPGGTRIGVRMQAAGHGIDRCRPGGGFEERTDPAHRSGEQHGLIDEVAAIVHGNGEVVYFSYG